jgi:hypothetical protein
VQTVDLGYRAREQFVPFHKRTQRWAVAVAHRRAGKTLACVLDLIDAALRCDKPDGRYAYVAPFYSQAKDVSWTYFQRYAGKVPGTVFNESELRVDFPNGARIRLYGADNPDRLRGLFLDGVVMDEYADMRPSVWGEVIRPLLADRRGWATFIGTPKGKNAFWQLWDEAAGDWFKVMLKASETGLIDAAELDAARRQMTDDQYAQEFECSFEAAIQGAYFGTEMRQAAEEKRIVGVPYEASSEVITAWDLGIGDSTAIWFAQIVGREIRLIDYYEASGAGLDHYARMLREKPYLYGGHILPFDADKSELGTGKTIREMLLGMSVKPISIAPKLSIDEGIQAARLFMRKCWFDEGKCKQGLEALRQYRREYDEKLKSFKQRPLHDWTSHAADAFRYLAVGLDKATPRANTRPIAYPKLSYA